MAEGRRDHTPLSESELQTKGKPSVQAAPKNPLKEIKHL